MRRRMCLALLLCLPGVTAGCSVPSYRMPAGYSSTYHRGVHGMGVTAAPDAVTAVPSGHAGGSPTGGAHSYGRLIGNSDLTVIDRLN